MLSYVAPSLTDLQARELIGSLLQEQDFSALIRVLQNTQAPHRIASWIGTEFQIPDVVRLYNDPGLSDQFEIKAALALALIERVVPFDRKDQSDVLLINRPISDSIARLMQNVENFSCLIQIEKALENLELSLGAEFIRRFVSSKYPQREGIDVSDIRDSITHSLPISEHRKQLLQELLSYLRRMVTPKDQMRIVWSSLTRELKIYDVLASGADMWPEHDVFENAEVISQNFDVTERQKGLIKERLHSCNAPRIWFNMQRDPCIANRIVNIFLSYDAIPPAQAQSYISPPNEPQADLAELFRLFRRDFPNWILSRDHLGGFYDLCKKAKATEMKLVLLEIAHETEIYPPRETVEDANRELTIDYIRKIKDLLNLPQFESLPTHSSAPVDRFEMIAKIDRIRSALISTCSWLQKKETGANSLHDNKISAEMVESLWDLVNS
jgi:hypothetical protein